MKKLFALIMCLCLCAGLALAEDENVSAVNPWLDMSYEELTVASGLVFNVPEDAEEPVFRFLPEANLAEMQFGMFGDEFCFRMQPAALEYGELMDISGMYFEWEYVEEVEIAYCYGTIGQAQDEDAQVELCQWYDIVPGVMYSLSVRTPELDGLDLTAIAEQIFVSLQGED